MARGKQYRPEQAVNLLRQIEVAVAHRVLKPEGGPGTEKKDTLDCRASEVDDVPEWILGL